MSKALINGLLAQVMGSQDQSEVVPKSCYWQPSGGHYPWQQHGIVAAHQERSHRFAVIVADHA